MPLPPHPRLLVSSNELPKVRERAQKLHWAKSAFNELLAQNTKRLAHPTTVPTSGGQWAHWYVCKKHGVRLETKSDTRHVCPIDGEIFTGWPYDQVIVKLKHAAFADEVRDMGLLFALTGERKYADRARQILLTYADLYLTIPLHDINDKPNARGGRISAQTLNESIWLIAMTQGADCIWDTLSPNDREQIATKLLRPAASAIRDHKMAIHNIQCWKNSAVGLVGLLLEDEELVADAIDSPHGLRAQLSKGIDADGMWYEGSWGYHFYTMAALMPLAEAAHSCGLDVYGPELKRMFEAPLIFAMPDGGLAPFNDSNPASAKGNHNYEIALARYNDARFAEPLAGSPRDSLQALIAGVDQLPSTSHQSNKTHNFPASGFAILQNKDTWLCLKYSQHGGWHGHYDKNSFVLYAKGHVIAGDPGTCPYGLKLHDEWYKTSLAHNTLVVDEANQHEATGQCLDFVSNDHFQAALLDAGDAIPGEFRRAAVLLNDNLVVFIDCVRTSDDKPHQLDLAVHPTGKWSETVAGEAIAVPKKPGYEHLRDFQSTGPEQLIKSPAGDVAITFAPAPNNQPTAFLKGTGVGKNLQDRVPVLIARRTANQTVYAWAIALDGKPAKLSLESVSNDAVISAIEHDGKHWKVTVDPSQPQGKRVAVRE